VANTLAYLSGALVRIEKKFYSVCQPIKMLVASETAFLQMNLDQS